tara:strand:+ start:304 stop:495 length:192 start_codon:yes stop_codon:yes gene_type:complete
MIINISVKNVYGNWLFYPECKISKGIAAIAKSKTLTKDNLDILKSIGYEINLVSSTTIKELLQ